MKPPDDDADNGPVSDPSESGKGGISPWWSLLILPIAAGIGWGIGLVPTTSAPKPTPAATTDAPPRATPPPALRVDTAPSIPAAPVQESGAPVAEVSGWTTYSSAVEESRRTGKPILLDFNAAWCPPCRSMKQLVFDDPGYGRRVQLAVIPVSIMDRQREEGRNSDEIESLMQRYRIEAFPTLVVFSPVTGMSEETRGFGGAEYTANWIAQAAERVR